MTKKSEVEGCVDSVGKFPPEIRGSQKAGPTYISLFLHIYQPPTQFLEVTKEIVIQSYVKIVDLLKRFPSAKVTLNICASLTEQLESLGFRQLIGDLQQLAKESRVEFTASAKYHPLLSKIPDKEIIRQVELNEETNQRVFGDNWHPEGFFPPEMAYERRVGKIIERLGYKWILLDESAFPRKAGFCCNDCLYRLKGGLLKIFFREEDTSIKIAFNEISNIEDFCQFLPKLPRGNLSYLILGMDGETFGHHHPGQLKFLEQFLKCSLFKLVNISELLTIKKVKEVDPLSSTWGITVEDAEHGRIFPRWDNPQNPVHHLQWELFDLVVRIIKKEELGINEEDRKKDFLHSTFYTLSSKALHSDQFFWAARDPCWHPEMVKQGAAMMRDVVLMAIQASGEERNRAEQLYSQIVETGKKLFGELVIKG